MQLFVHDPVVVLQYAIFVAEKKNQNEKLPTLLSYPLLLSTRNRRCIGPPIFDLLNIGRYTNFHCKNMCVEKFIRNSLLQTIRNP